MKRRLKGFTLVELVIVIAIVIILSVVSVPIYRGYTKNAKMSEGYALLGTILSSQKAYYSQYGNFLGRGYSSSKGNYTCYEEVFGLDARGNKYFTWFITGSGPIASGKHYYQTYGAVKKPEDLGGKYLYLFYDITSGTTLKDGVDMWIEDI